MGSPRILYPSGLVGDYNHVAGLPFTGLTLGPSIVSVPIPGVAFGTGAKGRSIVTMGAGNQGAIDLNVTTGATGTARSLVIVSDNINTPVNYIEISLTTTNTVTLVHKNGLGTTIAAVTGAFTGVGAGVPFHIRYAWNASVAIDGTRFALLSLNGASAGTWATDPQSSWAPFSLAGATSGVSVGLGLISAADFNGSIQRVQVGTLAVTT